MEQCLAACSGNWESAVEEDSCDELADFLDLSTDDDDTDSGDDDDDVTPPDSFSCTDLGLTVRAFDDVQGEAALYAKAADFTVQTTKGEWNFKEHWTGCETFLFIPEFSSQALGFDYDLFARDVERLFMNLPPNVHVCFLSYYTNEEQILTSLDQVSDQIDDYVAQLSEEEQNHWYHHLHLVTEPATQIAGWLGEALTSPRWGIGIDRLQRIRYIGSYADYTRYDGSAGWFAPNISMAANEAKYYNFESDREETLAADGATIVAGFTGQVLSDPDWAGQRGYVDITLPAAGTMATFDTLRLDLYLGCDGDGEYGTCPAWDYLVELYLCEAEDPDDCTVEIGRWITTYHREGRWVHDISPLLPLLADGGQRRFAFYTQQPYEVELSLRFSNSGKAVKPFAAHYLFSGGTFGPDYNMSYAPIELDVPADTTKVEIASAITGHGGASPGNCAEFCNTTHHFAVNGHEYVREFPEAGSSQDCMDKVGQGTVPNQYGTWWYGRSGWCPGKEVPLAPTDVTEQIVVGDDNTFTYYGLYNGEPYPNTGASISLTSWVVFYK